MKIKLKGCWKTTQEIILFRVREYKEYFPKYFYIEIDTDKIEKRDKKR